MTSSAHTAGGGVTNTPPACAPSIQNFADLGDRQQITSIGLSSARLELQVWRFTLGLNAGDLMYVMWTPNAVLGEARHSFTWQFSLCVQLGLFERHFVDP